jgi:ABC-type branched-subunit amino acid transport system ATPase component
VDEIKERLKILNQERGVGFLLVEHDIRFVKDLCERVVVLNYGAKLAEGPPEQIMEDAAVIEAYFGDDGGTHAPSPGQVDDAPERTETV